MLRLLVAILIGLIATAALGSDYSLRAGDKLRIEVSQDPDLDRSVLVLPDGSFTFPMVGTVRAKGHSVDDVRRVLTERLSPNFASPPDVYVSVTALAQRPNVVRRDRVTPRRETRAPVGKARIGVFVMGEVKRPGRIDVAPGTTLLQFLAQAGGLTPFAAEKRVQVQRRDTTSGHVRTMKVNVRAVMAGRHAAVDELADGDVIIVPERRLFE